VVAVGTDSVEVDGGSGRDPDHVPGRNLSGGWGLDDPAAAGDEVLGESAICCSCV